MRSCWQAVLPAIGDQYYPLDYLAIHTGMRQSELIGLQWSDLDCERKILQVQRQVYRPKGGGFEFTNLKTRKAHRSIILGDRMLEVLKGHRMDLARSKAYAGSQGIEYDMLLPNQNGNPINKSNL